MIKCFESNWNPNLNHVYVSYIGHHEIDERQCGDTCACQKLQDRARNDPYIFSLAPNPFYLWLICTVSNFWVYFHLENDAVVVKEKCYCCYYTSLKV